LKDHENCRIQLYLLSCL